MSLLVIFGAGASYDSVSATPPSAPLTREGQSLEEARPPLARELFQAREAFTAELRKYRVASPLFPMLQDGGGTRGVEGILTELFEESQGDPVRKRQFTALRYYIQHAVWHCENKWVSGREPILNHNALLEAIRSSHLNTDRRSMLVTFNYDTLIERALDFGSFKPDSLDAYVNRSDNKLIKLHGSTSWFRQTSYNILEIGAEVEARMMIDQTGNYLVTDNYYLHSHYPDPLRLRGKLPAIAVPTDRKIHFECPADHVEALRKFIPTVDRILSIGWRGQETAFTDLLKEGLSKPVTLGVVAENGQSADATFQTLSGQFGIRKFHPYSNGFSGFVQQRFDKHFLSAE